MQRADKGVVVDSIVKRLNGAKASIVAEYRGLTVDQMTALRNKVREAEGEVQVVKNRLTKLALVQSPTEGLDAHLKGPNALATAQQDPVPLAKALVEFAKEFELLKIKGGNIEGKAVNLSQIMNLATLPSREVLLSMLLSVMQATARDMASVLAAVPRGLVTALQAIANDKKDAA
jgi:large subunit ribosomal protein L10